MELDYLGLKNYGGDLAGSEIGTLTQPEVIEGDYTDLSYSIVRPEGLRDISDEEIRSFNDENHDAFTRLDNHVLDSREDILYIDEHNHALAGWISASNEGLVEGKTVLLHVDGHYDDRIPEPFYPPETVSEAESLIGDMLDINEFIYPAQQWNLIDDTVNWGVENTARERLIRDFEHDSVILDLDLDVFENIDYPEPVYRQLSELMSKADFTTVATSPGYIQQDKALNQLDKVMKEYKK